MCVRVEIRRCDKRGKDDYIEDNNGLQRLNTIIVALTMQHMHVGEGTLIVHLRACVTDGLMGCYYFVLVIWFLDGWNASPG